MCASYQQDIIIWEISKKSNIDSFVNSDLK